MYTARGVARTLEMTDRVLPGITRHELAEYLRDRLDVAGPVTLESVRLAGQGMSDDTILVDIVDADGARHPLAIRRYRSDGVVRELCDPQRHYRTLRALERTDLPTPRALWFDPDGGPLGGASFAMQRIEGAAPVPWSPQGRAFLEQAGRGPLGERFVSLLAEIHAVDWRGLGLGGELGNAAADERTCAQIELLGAMVERHRRGPEPVFADALGWLRANLPCGAETVLVHGDYRTGNLLYDRDKVTAVLDWEFAQPGDPMRDVAWVLAPSNRVGSDLACYLLAPERFAELYERFAGREIAWDAVRFWQVYHQVFNATMWMHAELRVARGETRDLRMLRWSYTLPTMRGLILRAMEDAVRTKETR
jgi:aminoglycoside phosphotransferase (APT) family kinase protein